MWVATFTRDTELEDVGTVTATWTGPEGESFTVLPRRVHHKQGLAEFVAEAKASLAAWQSKKAKIDAVAAKVTTALNS